MTYPISQFCNKVCHRGGQPMKEQTGYVYRKGKSWFVRFRDTQANGERKQFCKKLDVPLGARRKEAEVFAKEKFLDPINRGLLNPQSNMPIAEFVENVYLPALKERGRRASTQKQYRDTWEDH